MVEGAVPMSDEKQAKERVSQVLKSLPPEQKDQFLTDFMTLLGAKLESKIEEELPPAIDRMLSEIGYSRDVAGLVQLLAAKSNDNKQDVLRKALTLYGLALDAQEKGNRMAVLRPDDVIVRDVIGIGQGQESAQPVSR
jgi:hypothetical protein